MPSIEILDTGWIDRRDSAFPQAVQLPNGDILCSFNVGGGPNVHGGTDWARSTDGGVTWTLEGTILPLTRNPDATSALKLSRSADGETVFAYGSRSYRLPEEKFGEGRNEPVLCRSTDGGHTWSAPQVVPMPADCPLEISHGVLPLASGCASWHRQRPFRPKSVGRAGFVGYLRRCWTDLATHCSIPRPKREARLL